MSDPIIGHVGEARATIIERLSDQGFFKTATYESTLSNEIHEIFQYKHFDNLSEEAWSQMEPAFRLASRFIVDERVLSYFWHQMQSEPASVPPSEDEASEQITTNPPTYYKRKNGCTTDTDILLTQWNQQLNSITKRPSQLWASQDPGSAPRDMWMGITFEFPEQWELFIKRTSADKLTDSLVHGLAQTLEHEQCMTDYGLIRTHGAGIPNPQDNQRSGRR